jgi:3-methyladenine DNA glycosylase AlkD
MQKYMKSTMPYHGVMSPEAKVINKEVFDDLAFTDANDWNQTVRSIWDHATHREERYAALYVARSNAGEPYRTQIDALDLYRYLASSGAWWDYIDPLSTSHIGDVLRAHPGEAKKIMREWSETEDMWLRRCSIICQLASKGSSMDLPFLFSMISRAADRPEFFLRKAIGWALRQAAREFPEEIVRYVKENEAKLSALSVKEALKHFGGNVAAAERATKGKTASKKRSKSELEDEEENEEDDGAAEGASSTKAAAPSAAPKRRKK